jgi:hypothetical protein
VARHLTAETHPPRAKSLHDILLLSASDALTSCCRVDKNAHFLRQAVNFASRNGRSVNPSLKDKLLKDKLFLTDLRDPPGLDE